MLSPDRQPGPTFDIANIMFCDFESRGRMPISAGTDKYSRFANAIVLAWAIGDGPVHTEAVPNLDRPLCWEDLTYEFRKFFERVKRGEAVLCAHNASFDRAIWNNSTDKTPVTKR